MTYPGLHARLGRLVLPVVLGLALASAPASALAHAELVSTDPAAGAALTTPPTEVTLVFDGELNPDESAFTVTDADDNLVGQGALDLTVADRKELRGPVTIIEPGTYTVAWTAMSVDGHAEPGELAFTYAADGSEGAPPDTAATGGAEPSIGAGVIIVGLLALIAAFAAAVRMRRSETP